MTKAKKNNAPGIYIPNEFAGVDEFNVGRSYRFPNFWDWNSGRVPGRDDWDIVIPETKATADGLSWQGFLGFTVYPGQANKNKDETSFFFQHKSSGRWGGVLEMRHRHLAELKENNTAGRGCRLDEFMKKCLDGAGMEYGELSRRSFVRSFDAIMMAFARTMHDRTATRNLSLLRADLLAKLGFRDGVVARVNLRNKKTGKLSGEFKATASGSIRVDRR